MQPNESLILNNGTTCDAAFNRNSLNFCYYCHKNVKIIVTLSHKKRCWGIV